jgi:hypothetical protein
MTNQNAYYPAFLIILIWLGFTLLPGHLYAQNIEGITKEKPIKIDGSIGLGSMLTMQQGGAARRVPFTWYISGSPNVSLYGIQFPFTFVWSEQERNFTQPFNKYGVSPNYKWIKLHAGYRNVNWSNYTISGSTFFGGGIELNPGILRLGVIYGKFREKIIPNENTLTRFSYVEPSYERWGYAAKIGVGKGPNFIDLIVFNAKDRLDSNVARIADKNGINPMDNTAVGLKSKYSFFKYFDFSVDMALSAVTLDKRIQDPAMETPQQVAFGNGLMNLNISTIPYLAGETSLSFHSKKFRMKAQYKRVDPDFQSFGTYYTANDLEQLTLAPSWSMFKRKVNISGSYGIRRNNLLRDQIATTESRIGSANVAINASPEFGIALNYSNYGTDVNSGQIQLNDSILYSVVNQTYGGNIRYTKLSNKLSHTVILNGQYQNLNDNNIVTRAFTESSNISMMISYGLSHKPLELTFNTTFLHTSVTTFANTFKLIGPAINVTKKFKKLKLSTSARFSVQQKVVDNSSEGNISNLGFNVGYTPHKKHTLGLNANLMFNNTKTQSVYAFNEQRIGLRYTVQF